MSKYKKARIILFLIYIVIGAVMLYFGFQADANVAIQKYLGPAVKLYIASGLLVSILICFLERRS